MLDNSLVCFIHSNTDMLSMSSSIHTTCLACMSQESNERTSTYDVRDEVEFKGNVLRGNCRGKATGSALHAPAQQARCTCMILFCCCFVEYSQGKLRGVLFCK